MFHMWLLFLLQMANHVSSVMNGLMMMLLLEMGQGDDNAGVEMINDLGENECFFLFVPATGSRYSSYKELS